MAFQDPQAKPLIPNRGTKTMSKKIVQKIEQLLDDDEMDYQRLKHEDDHSTNNPTRIARASACYVCTYVTDNFSTNQEATINEMKRIIEIDSVDYDKLARRIMKKFKPTD